MESAQSLYAISGYHHVKKSPAEIYTASDTAYGYILNTEEDDTFLAKYGLIASKNEMDYFAGAMKYCLDKGLRLSTSYELLSLVNAIYGTSYTCPNTCFFV